MVAAEVCWHCLWKNLVPSLYIKSLLKSDDCRWRNEGLRRRTALVGVTRILHTHKAYVCFKNMHFSISIIFEFLTPGELRSVSVRQRALNGLRNSFHFIISIPFAKVLQLLISAVEFRTCVWSRQSVNIPHRRTTDLRCLYRVTVFKWISCYRSFRLWNVEPRSEGKTICSAKCS